MSNAELPTSNQQIHGWPKQPVPVRIPEQRVNFAEFFRFSNFLARLSAKVDLIRLAFTTHSDMLYSDAFMR